MLFFQEFVYKIDLKNYKLIRGSLNSSFPGIRSYLLDKYYMKS